MAKHWRQLRAELLDRSQEPALERYHDQSWRPKAPNTQRPVGVGLTVECPWCRAAAGQPCLRFKGGPAKYVHALRAMAESGEQFVGPGTWAGGYALHLL